MFDVVLFGRYVARLRRNANMTQSDLALRLNVTRQAISKYERGDCFPDISVLVELSEALGVSTEALIAAGQPSAGEACILDRLVAGEPPGAVCTADVLSLAPLLRPATVAALAERLAADGVNISKLVELTEYLSDDGARHLLTVGTLEDLSPELLTHLLPFIDADSYWTIVDGILEGWLDWHLIGALRLDRQLLEAAVVAGVIPDEALWWQEKGQTV